VVGVSRRLSQNRQQQSTHALAKFYERALFEATLWPIRQSTPLSSHHLETQDPFDAVFYRDSGIPRTKAALERLSYHSVLCLGVRSVLLRELSIRDQLLDVRK
jgi:hypothetical protein